MNKRKEELQTEDGNSDKHEGVEEEPGMSKRSRDLDTDVNSWEPTLNDSLHLPTVHPNNNDNNNIGHDMLKCSTHFPIGQYPKSKSVAKGVTFSQTRSSANINNKGKDDAFNISQKLINAFSTTSECDDIQRKYTDSLTELEMKMKGKIKDEFAKVTQSIEEKLRTKSGYQTIMKIHGLENPKCTFDGTLTQWRPFATELRQWCKVYEIKGELALIILGQRLREIAKSLWETSEKKINGDFMSLESI